jgi:predicted HicB family RNase H-like nuclease
MAEARIAHTLRIPGKTHKAARIEAARNRESFNAYVVRLIQLATQAESKPTRKKPA